MKTSTAAVRTAYIECMSACFHGNTLAQGIEFIPLLLKTVEKAVAQSAQVCFCVVVLCSYRSTVKHSYDSEVSVMLIIILWFELHRMLEGEAFTADVTLSDCDQLCVVLF